MIALSTNLIATASLATRATTANINTHWPLVLESLKKFDINTLPVQIAIAATIAAETRDFLPKKEIKSLYPGSKVWLAQQKYWPSGYMGRGFMQITWKDNYQKAAQALGIPLLTNPDLALQPDIAADIAAWFFKNFKVSNEDPRKIYQAAQDQDWPAVRRGVNGPGYAKMPGYPEYLKMCENLMEATNAVV